jgi:hypothetical protein
LVQAVLVLHLSLLALMEIHQFMEWLWLAVEAAVHLQALVALAVEQ